MSGKRKPLFQLVDGVKIPLGFSPESLRSCLQYKPSPGDIFIDTFPKCGTNWAKRIVQLLLGRDTSDCSDYGLSTSFFEMVGNDVIQNLPQPRIICTHLEYHLLPQHKEAKYIYIVRNPKDCCVSFFYHTQKTKVYEFEDATFDEYLDLFIRGETSYGDYFSHLVSWYPKTDLPNVLFLTYEGMKKDPAKGILKMAEFLAVPDAELRDGNSEKFKAVVEACSVDSMRQYLKTNYDRTMADKPAEEWSAKKDYPLDRAPPPPDVMVRKGVIGDWRNHFSAEQSDRIERAFSEKCGSVANANDLWDPKDWVQGRSV
ncbi:sulfotransferase ssu-1-like isoform X2 [Ornithodoros turicata]